MEDIIAKFPEDFFPRKHLILKGRQGTLSGVGRYDLLFEDEHRTQILMELKARPAKYQDADQLAKYKDALSSTGRIDFLMWLIATHIPASIRDALDRFGIEYTEIHVSEFENIANRRGFVMTETNIILDQNQRQLLNNTVENTTCHHDEVSFEEVLINVPNVKTFNKIGYYTKTVTPQYRINIIDYHVQLKRRKSKQAFVLNWDGIDRFFMETRNSLSVVHLGPRKEEADRFYEALKKRGFDGKKKGGNHPQFFLFEFKQELLSDLKFRLAVEESIREIINLVN